MREVPDIEIPEFGLLDAFVVSYLDGSNHIEFWDRRMDEMGVRTERWLVGVC